MKSGVVFLLLLLSATLATEAQESSAPLRSIHSVLELTNEEAARNPEVDVVGVVTYVDYSWSSLFISEGKRAIYVSAPAEALQGLCFGDWVRVRGEARNSDVLPIIGNAWFEPVAVSGDGMPEPGVVSASDLRNLQSLDARWVELSGLVADHYQFGNRAGFVLAVGGHLVKVLPAESIPELEESEALGTFVRIRGHAHALKEPDVGITALEILVHDASQVEILSIEDNSLLGNGERSFDLNEFMSMRPQRSAIATIAGQITLKESDRTVFVEDETGGARVRLKGDSDLLQGDLVEMIVFKKGGYAHHRELLSLLTRRTGRAPMRTPLELEPQEVSATVPANRLVRVHGILRESIKVRNSTEMKLTCDGVTYYANVLDNSGLALLLKRAKELELTGVCEMTRSESGRFPTMTLLIQDARGVNTLSVYPVWNREMLESVIQVLLAIAFICGIWLVALRRRVGEQTAAIRSQAGQLVQAQKMDAVGRLAGGIAHDFNNLLVGISGNLAMLKLNESKLTPGGLGYVEAAESAASRAKELVKQMLGFSRKSTLQMEVTDANAVVSRLLELIEHSFDKTIELEQDLADDLWRVRADGTHLEQVLMNLCVNAKDAMLEGRGRILVRTRNYTATGSAGLKGDYVVISVRDDGCGMREEIREKIFEPFFTTKPLDRGTGLGLAMSHGIIEQHGGRIECSSEVGVGTCFTIYLPRTKDGSLAERRSEPADGNLFGKEQVLVVDDEAVVRAVAQGFLRHHGYRVSIAEDGRSALEKVVSMRSELDIVLMDLTMPRMTGKEAFHKIKSIYPDLPTVICSGHLVDFDGFVKETGFRPDVFIQKPYELQSFLAAIRTVLDRKAGAAGHPAKS